MSWCCLLVQYTYLIESNFSFLQIENFLSKVPASWDNTLTSYAYTVQKHIEWRAENEDKIARWLGMPTVNRARMFKSAMVQPRKVKLQRPTHMEMDEIMERF